VGAFEGIARLAGGYLDYDRQHIYTFPAVARRLADSPSPRVLFLGNSLARTGLHLDTVREELRRLGAPEAELARMVPVGTDITDWVYLYKKHFAGAGRAVDVVVIGFTDDHVRDVPAKRLRRLGRHFISPSSIPELFERDVTGFGDRVEVLLSYGSACFGDQLLYRDSALWGMIPNCQSGTGTINDFLRHAETKAHAAEGIEPPPPTYHRLERLIELLRQDGVRGIFVAMPLPRIRPLDPNLARTVRAGGMTFIDARQIAGIESGSFQDGYHLNDAGAERYSRFIAAELCELLGGGTLSRNAESRPGLGK